MGWRIRTANGDGKTMLSLGVEIVPLAILVLICVTGPIGMQSLLGSASIISMTSGFTDVGVKAGVHAGVVMMQ
jgi:hypothetical protein